MFGWKKSKSEQQIGDFIELVVDSYETAQSLAPQIQMQTCVEQVYILQKTRLCINFRQFHSNSDKQPVLDLLEISGIDYVS